MIDGKNYVAWKMLDGNVMAGELIETFCEHSTVMRVDGSRVRVKSRETWEASADDVLSACAFYQNIGRA